MAETEVGVDEAARRIAVRFPELAGLPVEPFASGWDNTAFLVDGTWVFRFPRKPIAVQFLRTEIRAAPWLAPQLPWPITAPTWVADGDAPFAGYRKLPGRPLVEADLPEEALSALAEPLGRFVKALHAVSIDEAAARGLLDDPLGKADVAWRAPRLVARLEDLAARGLVDATPFLRIVADAAPVEERVVVHGDLDARHVLVDGGSVSGVIDWGDLHLGPRACDLSAMWHVLPVASHDAFRAAYGPIDAATERLARFRALDVATAVLLWAADTSNPVTERAARATFGRLRD